MSTILTDPYVRIYNRLADGGEICSGGFDPKNDPDDRRKLMLFVLASLLFVLIFVIFSSCTRRIYIPVERTTTTVKTLVDTVVEVKLDIVHDTTTIMTPGKDTTSYLYNDYAYSFASYIDGNLGHSLGINPGATVRDSIQLVYIHTTDSIPYPVEVEKKLTFWQKAKIEFGGFAMGISAALAVFLALTMKLNNKKNN
ncbi:MAG: hypothetical protein IJY59_01995 [Bacteroidaceae bacterium]|nr:hypothetical protein [Bacteroidaceae bacterium]